MRIAALAAIVGSVLTGTTLAQMMPTIDESASVAEQWDQRYGMERYIYGTEPVEFLVEQIDRLPRGRALCLAAGEGRNAVWLAQQGYEVTAAGMQLRVYLIAIGFNGDPQPPVTGIGGAQKKNS